MESATLLTKTLPGTFSDNAWDFEVKFAYLVPVMVLLQASEVCNTAINLASWRSSRPAVDLGWLISR